MRIIVTRPQAQATAWVDALQHAGLDAVSLPLIHILPVADTTALQAAWRTPQQWDAWMFVSTNAIDGFFAARPEEISLPMQGARGPLRWWVTGPGSRKSLIAYGLSPEQLDSPPVGAGRFDSEALWSEIAPQVHARMRVLIVRGDTQEAVPEASTAQAGSHVQGVGASQGVGRDWLSTRLQSVGAAVQYVVAYRRSIPAWSDAQRLAALCAASDGSVWLFSASEAVSNLRALCLQQDWSAARCVATHPRIAQAARDAGFGVVCESRPELTAVIGALKSVP